MEDAVKESKGIVPEDEVNVEFKNEEATQNNDFCFTNDDFVKYCKELSDATRYQDKYRDACNIIKGLK